MNNKIINVPTVAGALLLAFIVWGVSTPEGFGEITSAISGWIAVNLRWYYIGLVSVILYLCIGLAISPWGKITLGKKGEKPEFGTGTWVAMLFAAGMGIGLVFWSVAEPMWHFNGNPYIDADQALTSVAADSAMLVTIFHWGFHPWALYGIVAMIMGYFAFRKGTPLAVSSTLEPLIGKKAARGALGGIADVIAIFATVAGLATSLGLGVLQINDGLNSLAGIPQNPSVQIILIAVISAAAIASVLTGLYKGILYLSRLNVGLAVILATIMLIAGPTVYLLSLIVQTFGDYLVNVFSLGSNTFANQPEVAWPNFWTTFYWAWWISWVPFVGSFIARISRGRTIREFVVGVLVVPTLMSLVWISIMGGTALNLELASIEPGTAGILEATKEGSEKAMLATFAAMNLGGFFEVVLSLIVVFLVAIFFVTSCDSGTLVVSMLSTKGNMNPKGWVRLFWGLLIAGIAAVLLLSGGLSSVQTVAIMAALPFSLVMIFMFISFFKALVKES